MLEDLMDFFFEIQKESEFASQRLLIFGSLDNVIKPRQM